jgi:FkbM family methyltransferase
VTWTVEEPPMPNGWLFWNAREAGWEQDTLDVIDRFATPGLTVVDIGAWIGPTALWAAERGAHVVAIEPDPVALSFLRLNIEANAADVTIVQGAVANEDGTCRIAPREGWGMSMTHVAESGLEVPCWSIATLFEQFQIDGNVSLVKMDIEGGEATVLETVAPFLAQRGIPLVVSMHEQWWWRPVEAAWFSGYATVEGELRGRGQVLALP